MFSSKVLSVTLFLFTFIHSYPQSFTYTGPNTIYLNFGQTGTNANYQFSYSGLSGLTYPGLIISVNGEVINNDLCHNPSTPESYQIYFTPGTYSVQFSLFSVNPNTLNCNYPLIHQVINFEVTVYFRIRVQNIFSGGTIFVNDYTSPKTSPFDRATSVGDNFSIGAIDQQNGAYSWIWNNSGINNSTWKKQPSTGEFLVLTSNRNATYSVQANDINTTLIAGLKKNFIISRNDETEFDGTEQVGEINRIVEETSGQISAPVTKSDIYNFSFWKDNFSHTNPRTISPNDNITYIAVYKYSNHSNNTDAYSNNSQRKFIRTADGVLHNVYESMGHVWYEISTDNGSTWNIMNSGKPLDNGAGKHPSIDYYGNVVAAVWQEKDGNNFKIKVATFYSYGGEYILGNSSIVPVTLPGSFSDDILPVIAWGYNGKAIVIWKGNISEGFEIVQKLLAVNGSINYNSATWYSEVLVTSTDYRGYNPSIVASKTSPLLFHLAWEERTSSTISKIRYKSMSINANNEIVQNTTSEASYSSGFTKNYNPSITMLQQNGIQVPKLIWIGYRELPPIEGKVMPKTATQLTEVRAVFRENNNGVWSPYSIYDQEVRSVNINRTEDGYYVAGWTKPSGTAFSTKYVRSSAPSNIRSFWSTGEHFQINNASSFSNMYANSFRHQTLPYSFQVSNSVAILGKEDGDISIAYGREGVIKKDSLEIYFILSDVLVNGETIEFTGTEEEKISIENPGDLNKYLISKPFGLNSNSSFTYGIQFGILNHTAAETILDDNNFISFRVELFDAENGEILGVYDDMTITRGNKINYYNMAYNVNTTGIGSRTVRLRLVIEDNIEADYALGTIYADESSILTKTYESQISYQGSLKVTDYALSQNYPNPFNPNTIIKYQIPVNGLVSLKIYDILGKEIVTLVNEEKSAGRYEVNFNASDLASGVYIYQVKVNEYVETRKMVLMK